MEIYEKLGDWLIPALIAGAIYQLQKIASEIKEIHKSLAIFGTRVEEHARRIERLEEEARRSLCDER